MSFPAPPWEAGFFFGRRLRRMPAETLRPGGPRMVAGGAGDRLSSGRLRARRCRKSAGSIRHSSGNASREAVRRTACRRLLRQPFADRPAAAFRRACGGAASRKRILPPRAVRGTTSAIRIIASLKKKRRCTLFGYSAVRERRTPDTALRSPTGPRQLAKVSPSSVASIAIGFDRSTSPARIRFDRSFTT